MRQHVIVLTSSQAQWPTLLVSGHERLALLAVTTVTHAIESYITIVVVGRSSYLQYLPIESSTSPGKKAKHPLHAASPPLQVDDTTRESGDEGNEEPQSRTKLSNSKEGACPLSLM